MLCVFCFLFFLHWIVTLGSQIVSSTGLPFKAPHQADQLAQCDHLRLSLKRFCLFRRSANWFKNHCRRISWSEPPHTHQIEAKWCKIRSPKSLDSTAPSRWAGTLSRDSSSSCHSFWEDCNQSTFGNIYEKGLHLAIDKRIFWLTNMVYFLLGTCSWWMYGSSMPQLIVERWPRKILMALGRSCVGVTDMSDYSKCVSLSV